MPDLPEHRIVLLLSVGAFTAATTWTDVKSRRIDNVMTIPMLILGLCYQIFYFGNAGLLNGLIGSGSAFLIFFSLWQLRLAGGGDVKLVSSLGVWMGAALTPRVILVSFLLVAVWVVFSELVARGLRSADFPGSAAQHQIRRRAMAYAPPVALATWVVLLESWRQW